MNRATSCNLLIVVILALVTVPAWSLTNLLPDPGMETDENTDGIADGWAPNVHQSEGAEGGFAIDTEVKRSGNSS